MLRTITLAIALTTVGAGLAKAQSGYGTEGPGGVRLTTQAESTWDRHWNANNESKYRAENSARWLREHGQGFPAPF